MTLDYDIMLIKLFHPVKITKEVSPLRLPNGCPYGGAKCSVSGWGNTALDGNGGSIQNAQLNCAKGNMLDAKYLQKLITLASFELL